MPERKNVGKRIKRTEDPRLITGQGTFVDDVKIPGMAVCAILRSPYAHARIRAIRVNKARELPGVLAVVTGKDIRDRCGTIPCIAAMEGMRVPKKFVLAVDKVVFVGDPVAAVVATDSYVARDALDLIEVDYQPLQAVTDARRAAAEKAPVIYPGLGSNVAFQSVIEGGDVEAAFREADIVLEQDLVHQRLIPLAMEPRVALAHYEAGPDQLSLWTSTQIPHLARTHLAGMLRMAENRIRVIAPDVGGAFGSKLNVYGEEALVSFLSRQLGRPVKWTETRQENMSSTIHGRAQTGTVRVAVKKSGRITGLAYSVVADMGAYLQFMTPAIPTLTGLMITGCYNIPAAKIEITGVYTNKMSTDAYRGAGRPEATYVIERTLDLVAARLGKDPAEVRRRNFIKKFPHATATQLMYDSGNYPSALDLALQKAGYQKLRTRQEKLRRQGKLFGIGLSSYIELCAVGPSAAIPCGGWESATVRIEPTGSVTIMSGTSPHGQGEETSFAQIAADLLGTSMDDVRVIHGDTAIVQYGIGTFGSRTTAVGGTAIVRAIEQLLEKAKIIAASMLGVKAGVVVFKNGSFSTAKGKKKVTLRDVATSAHNGTNVPPGMEPGLSASYFYEPSNFTFPFGTHICAVQVDRESGQVQIEKFVAVDDCGNQINPLLVDGQIHGGIAQGLGQALYEEALYDSSGNLVNGSLMHYAIPRAHHMPWIETWSTVTPSPVNPLGVKGVGEAGTIGATPAVVNAVMDALAPLGIRHLDMPLTPHKIWQAIRQSSAAS